MLEAAYALIDLGERAESLLNQCQDVHVSCATWIPTMIQAYSYECHFAPREAFKCLDSLGSAFDASLEGKVKYKKRKRACIAYMESTVVIVIVIFMT